MNVYHKILEQKRCKDALSEEYSIASLNIVKKIKDIRDRLGFYEGEKQQKMISTIEVMEMELESRDLFQTAIISMSQNRNGNKTHKFR